MDGRRAYRVFTHAGEGGVRVGVIDVAAGATRAELQAFATRTRDAVTVFLARSANPSAPRARFFTPKFEMPFSAAGLLAASAFLDARSARLEFDTDVGRVHVTRDDRDRWLALPAPELLNMPIVAYAARSISLSVEDVDGRFMPQAINAGVPFLVIPLVRPDALARARFALTRLRELLPRVGAAAVIVFAPRGEPPHRALSARVFTEAFGVDEDPANGEAVGALGAWLAEHAYFGAGPIDLDVCTGPEASIAGRVRLFAESDDLKVVRVGGTVVELPTTDE